ncbi:hypothetical protein VZT92_002374 [Zoarces viviparus]|uniref:Uncharacterized protein n=1 Tax=Zoarces viviparus TaxID=48416 RepID=A0AAW1FZV1_ZOAVI
MECGRSSLDNNTSRMLSIALMFSSSEPGSLLLTQLVFVQMTQMTIKGTDRVPEARLWPPVQYAGTAHSP